MTSPKPIVFMCELIHETNSFSPIPTGAAAWREEGFFRRNASLEDPTGVGAYLACFRKLAEADGFCVTESLCAVAQPAAPTSRIIYEDFRDQILADLTEAGHLAFVILVLHGAMIAEGYDDCEGDLIERVRAIVGPRVPIGVELDPHCHLTERMTAAADAIVMMKEYPHTDFAERAAELHAICKGIARGALHPVSAVFDCHMVGFFPTTIEPMAGLVRMMKAAEQEPGILSVSLAHGFSYGDQPEAGVRVLVIADGDQARAQATAARLGLAIYAAREELLPNLPDIPEVLRLVPTLEGRIVLADMADNTGAGAPGDSTALLAALLDSQGLCAFGAIYDPGAVQLCQEAGEGAEVSLRIGGKLGVSSGQPLDVVARVMALRTHHFQSGLNKQCPLGACAWIRIGSVDVVLSSVRSQVYSPDAFTGLGITLEDKRIIGVKSNEHFRAGFKAIADHIVQVATPGAIQVDFANLPYRKKRDLNYHPRVRDPLGLDG